MGQGGSMAVDDDGEFVIWSSMMCSGVAGFRVVGVSFSSK